MRGMNTPPTKIRMTVPVSPEVQAVFQRLSKATGMSTGRAMGEWLEDTLDGASAMSAMVERARESPKQAVREMHSYALGLTDLTNDLIETVKRGERVGVKGIAPATPSALPQSLSESLNKLIKNTGRRTLTPPSSNTGGKVPVKAKKPKLGK
jgi:hypothetical protein